MNQELGQIFLLVFQDIINFAIKPDMQAEYKKFPYKVVNLQELARKNQSSTIPLDLPGLVGMLDKPTREERFGLKKQNQLTFEEKLLCYKDTAANDQRVFNRNEYNNFFNAFFEPYNNHGDVFLVPDDVWLMISLFLSKYIDKHAEKLRSQFVKHEGQKELIIKEYASSIEQSLKMEKEWDFFFKEIIKQIDQNTLPGTVDALSCNFTTTDEVYKLISTSIIMSSFKNYFTYGRAICMCGLNNIYFAGTREDWVKLQTKLKFLDKYDADGQLKNYVEKVGVILSKFLDTFDGKPDLNWWNTIMTSEVRRIGSGGDTQTNIEGWILHFYGIYTKVEVDRIPKTAISVPIKLINEFTNTEKKLELIADWVSVSKVNEYTYKPDIGMCIVERERKTA